MLALLPFQSARAYLSAYTLKISVDIQQATGKLCRVNQDTAPGTFEALQAAWGDREAMTYSVASEGLAGSVYVPVPFGLGKVMPPEMVNARARYWHDYTHHRYACDFSHLGELSTAWHQLFTLAHKMHAACEDPRAILSACTLLWVDTAGQALFYERNAGAFVTDQLAFGAEGYDMAPQDTATRRRIMAVIADAYRCQ